MRITCAAHDHLLPLPQRQSVGTALHQMLSIDVSQCVCVCLCVCVTCPSSEQSILPRWCFKSLCKQHVFALRYNYLVAVGKMLL